ncbi:hypothetical protein DBT_0433 [Dissulfuribacter thermophilus]|uniref:Uncharacterized protein n=1 Tax=Dissulfuribacter thermophilus TaxID=1156395 RepID=A0A1B9F873_9BACT|nr:antitoxin [Dissulfuribacter thermophilus]OCC15971.1 hypothetical protein DBT_0433 [Dissulfuribacter thermophilus]
MKSKAITIRGIDEALSSKLKEIARKEKKSVNQLVLDAIMQKVGIAKDKKYTRRYDDLDHLFGKWTEEEFSEIQEAINSQRKIDVELWK